MQPDDNFRSFPSRPSPRSHFSQDKRNVGAQTSHKNSNSKVGDAWNKIASDLERIDNFGSEYDDFDSWNDRNKGSVNELYERSTENSPSSDDASSPVNASARESLRRSANALPAEDSTSFDDKLSEDYETRSKRRRNSVWNAGGWTRSCSNEKSTRERSSSYDRQTNGSRRYRSREYDPGRRSQHSDNVWDYGRRRDDSNGMARTSRFSPGTEHDEFTRQNDRFGSSGTTRFQTERTSSHRNRFERTPSYRENNSPRWNYRSDKVERSGVDGINRANEFNSQKRGSFGSGRENFGRRADSRRISEPESTLSAVGRYGEPLSLAEEYADKYVRHNDSNEISGNMPVNQANGSSELNSDELAALQEKSIYELIEEARRLVDDPRGALVKRVLHERVVQAGLLFGSGTLEILPDGFGFLRSVETSYQSCSDDVYVSPSQIRRFSLRSGLVISGLIRPPKERERYFALLRIDSINDRPPASLATTPFFDDLVASRPTERLKFELKSEKPGKESETELSSSLDSTLSDASSLSPTPGETADASKGRDMRLLDLVLPFAFGQRALVVCPPRSGKTRLIRKMIASTLKNYDDVLAFVLLVKKRPEDVTEARRILANERCEVVGSTFDESDARCVQLARMVFEKAKRAVEYGKKVVVFVDSLTRLVDAWRGEEYDEQNLTTALQFVRKLFGSSRKIDGGGSLTVVATSLLDQDSHDSQLELDALQAVGHATLWLDKGLAEKNIWPPINVAKSSVRDCTDFISEEERSLLEKIQETTRALDATEAIQSLLVQIAQTSSNLEPICRSESDSSEKER